MGATTDLLLTFGPFDISGESGMAEGKQPLKIDEHFVAPPAGLIGQLPMPTRVVVGEDFSGAASGYHNDATTQTALRENATRNDVLVGLAETRGVGQPVTFARCVRADYARTGDVGTCWQYQFTWMVGAHGSLWDDGTQGEYDDVSADGNGAGFQYGAVAADERLVVAAVAERLSGTGSIVITWKTATAGTFVGETTILTFDSIEEVSEEIDHILFEDGSITDTWHRPGYDVTGTGEWRIRIYLAKETIPS